MREANGEQCLRSLSIVLLVTMEDRQPFDA